MSDDETSDRLAGGERGNVVVTRIAGKQYRIAARCPHDPHGNPGPIQIAGRAFALFELNSYRPKNAATAPNHKCSIRREGTRHCRLWTRSQCLEGRNPEWIYLYRLYKEYDEIEQHCMRKMPSRLLDDRKFPEGAMGGF